MKHYVLDACTVINLYNAEILEDVLLLGGISFYIGDLVLDECSKNTDQSQCFNLLINDGKLNFLNDKLELSELLQVKELFFLGIGESESIALAYKFNFNIATDDKKARSASRIQLGEDRLSGSIYFIKQLIIDGVIECNRGLFLIQLMKSRGGFLPNVNRNYLCD